MTDYITTITYRALSAQLRPRIFRSNRYIKTKLTVMLLVVSVCAMVASTYICSSSGKATLTEKVFNQLTSLRAAKTDRIQDYFESLYHHSQTLSEDLGTGLLTRGVVKS